MFECKIEKKKEITDWNRLMNGAMNNADLRNDNDNHDSSNFAISGVIASIFVVAATATSGKVEGFFDFSSIIFFRNLGAGLSSWLRQLVVINNYAETTHTCMHLDVLYLKVTHLTLSLVHECSYTWMGIRIVHPLFF